jgi:putative ABC transport system substrate-binding protein
LIASVERVVPNLDVAVRRRDFIAGIVGSAVAWPIAARGQQAAMPVIGYLGSTSSSEAAPILAPFRQGLREAGFVEGQNVTIEYRFADYQYARLPDLAADLVSRRVAVIAASPAVAARPAVAATKTIPIVFQSGGDPVALGLVASLNRPEANVTGVSAFGHATQAKRLELLSGLAPNGATIGFLVNPNNPNTETDLRDLPPAAAALGLKLMILKASTANEIETAFTTFARMQVSTLLVATDSFFLGRTTQFVVLAARHSLPAMFGYREFTEAGGLMSYGTILADTYRQCGVYVGRILKGAQPSELPVMLPTKFELVINLRTARALGITMPPTLLALADEVIE